MIIKEKITGTYEKRFDGNYGNYWLGKTQSANKLIINETNNYKKKQLKTMKSLNPRILNPRSRRYINFEDGLIVTVKRDGEFNTCYYDIKNEPGSIFCNSPRGRARYNLPVNREIHSKIKKINSEAISIKKIRNILGTNISEFSDKDFEKIDRIFIAGELFVNVTKKTTRPRVSDFLAISKNPKSREDLENVYYDVFDIISINGINVLNLSYEFRLAIIDILFPREKKKIKGDSEGNKVKVIPYEKEVQGKTAHLLYNQWVEQENQEGIVIHDIFKKVYKVKKVHTIDAIIIGFSEMLKEKRIRGFDAVSALLVALMRSDGTYQILTRVGGGIEEDQRIDLYKLLKDDIVKSKYKETNREGRAFRFVKPKYIIQLKYLDIISEDFEGRSKLRMALEFKDNLWTIKRVVPFVSLINPYFNTMRSEIDKELYPTLEYENPKQPIYEDVKIDQIFDVAPIDSPRIISDIDEEMSKIKILLRIVFQVKWGGVSSAKKILLWETNKHEVDNAFPRYIVYTGDYSYKRSKPLDQSIYPFTSLEKAIKHLNYIFKRPDNKNKGFLDTKTQTTLKKSIKTPPYDLFIDDDIKRKMEESLEEPMKDLILKSKVKKIKPSEAVSEEIIDLDDKLDI